MPCRISLHTCTLALDHLGDPNSTRATPKSTDLPQTHSTQVLRPLSSCFSTCTHTLGTGAVLRWLDSLARPLSQLCLSWNLLPGPLRPELVTRSAPSLHVDIPGSLKAKLGKGAGQEKAPVRFLTPTLSHGCSGLHPFLQTLRNIIAIQDTHQSHLLLTLCLPKNSGGLPGMRGSGEWKGDGAMHSPTG